MTYKGFHITISRRGPTSWTSTVTHPDDARKWQSSSTWTPWGAVYDARWVIDRYLSRAVNH